MEHKPDLSNRRQWQESSQWQLGAHGFGNPQSHSIILGWHSHFVANVITQLESVLSIVGGSETTGIINLHWSCFIIGEDKERLRLGYVHQGCA